MYDSNEFFVINFSVESHLDSHLNADLLRRLNLIVPRDFIKEESQIDNSIEGKVSYYWI